MPREGVQSIPLVAAASNRSGLWRGVSRDRSRPHLTPGAGTGFKGIDRARRCIVLECARGKPCDFTLDPTPGKTTVVNPCFVIEGWGDRPVSVAMDGRPLVRGRDFESGVEEGAAVIWARATFDAPTVFSVK